MSDIRAFVTALVEEARNKEGEKVAAPANARAKRHAGPGSNGGVVSAESLGTCPKCGASVVETKKAYGCSAWKAAASSRSGKTSRASG
jgi:DNA topoisomerase-3